MQNKNKTHKPEATPAFGYYSVCFYSLPGNGYVEENRHFEFKAKTYEGLINKLNAYYKTYSEDKDYHIYEPLKAYDSFRDEPHHFTLESAYTFGPKVLYEIFIKKVSSASSFED